MSINKNKNIELAKALVKELGGENKIASICNIKTPSVYGWYKYGIPDSWLAFFKVKYPKLQIWELHK